MNPAAQPCPSCGFDNPRAWRACSRCGHPLGLVKSMTGRTYLSGADATVVTAAPAFPPASEEITDEAGEPDSQPPTPVEDIEPPLVGQADATSAIHSGLTNAFEQGKPTLVVLEGTRGSGKTRLLFHASEVAARMKEDVRVLYGACRAQGGDGYYAPFGRMLLERFGVTPSSAPSAVRGQMATHVGDALQSSDAIAVAETTHLLGHIAGVPFPDSPFLRTGEEPDELRQRALAAFTRFVTGDAKRRRLIVLLDNMHAAEDDGWELVEAALAGDAPIAVVVAGDAPVAERAERLEAPGGVAIGPIAPLSEADVASLLQILLPTLKEAQEPLVAALTHRSRGNPSALRELVFALVEAKVFQKSPEGLTADLAQLEAGNLPVTMEDAVRARLMRLDPLERATLDRAAVVGEVFQDRCLLAMMRSERRAPGDAADPATLWPDDDDEAALTSALARLEEKGFVERVEASDVPGAVELRFLHSDTRDLVYAEQDEALRVERHRTIAHWLSVVIELQRAGMAAVAAPHLEKAGMSARAGRAYLEAAHAERDRIHTQTALRYAEKALELIDEGDVARRIDALHLHGSLLTTTGRYDEARSSFVEMLQVSWRIGAKNKGGAALNRLARIHRHRGEDAQASQLLERALELFRAAADLRGVASSLDDLAQVARLHGDLERASNAATEALEIRRGHADVRGEAVSLMTLGGIEYARGEIGRAEELFESARDIRESIGDRAGVMQVYNALGVVAFDRGDLERAEACWRAAMQEARKMADRHTQTFLLNNLGELLTAGGRTEEAKAALDEARELAHQLKNRRAMAEVERNLGLCALKAGAGDAEKILLRALALAEEYGSREAIGLAHRAIGQMRGQTLFDDKGEVSRRAEESFLASIDTFRDIGNEKEAARSLASLGYHLIERGDVDSAKERLREARAIMRRIGLGQLAKVETTLEELGGRISSH